MPETRKIVKEASESVDGENEVKDGGERVHGSKRHEEEREGRKREREEKRERAKRGRPDDELAEMTSRAKSLR